MKKERENTGKKYYDDGTIDDGDKENGLRDNKDFMGLMRMRMLPARPTMPIWMC